MSYFIWLFIVAISLFTTSAHSQTGTGCEALLLKQDIDYLKWDEKLRYHFINAIDEATFKKLQQEVGVTYMNVIGANYGYVQNEREVLRQRTSQNFSQEESMAFLKLRTSKKAIDAFVECRKLSSESGFLDTIITGDPRGVTFNVTIVWKPDQRDGNMPLEQVDSDVIKNIPSTLPRGKKTFRISRNTPSETVMGYINGFADKSYTAQILIPAWQEIVLRPVFPIKLSTLSEYMCVARNIPPCIKGDDIITPPVKAGTGEVTFYIPDGARRFEAILSHYDLSGCNGPNGDWTGQAFVDGKLAGQWHMLGLSSRTISIELPNGAKRLKLSAIDNNNSEWCDDSVWRSAVFTD